MKHMATRRADTRSAVPGWTPAATDLPQMNALSFDMGAPSAEIRHACSRAHGAAFPGDN